MQPFTTPNKIVITCHKWLSPALASEVTALGFSVTRSFQTGVEIMGTINDCIKLNLQLRTASQVLYSIKTFNCNNPDELYENLCTIEWEKIIDPGGYFSVTSNVFHTTITTNLFANLRVKDAGNKGLGVFSDVDIPAGKPIEFCHSIVMEHRNKYQNDPEFRRYSYWANCDCEECKRHGSQAVLPLGNGCIYNSAESKELSN